MREDGGYKHIEAACKALGANWEEHIHNYGHGIEDRLTGHHETAPWNKFNYGVSDRGASIRIPWQVHKDGKGYLEDRRPNANMDPYVVTRLMVETVCSAAEGKAPRKRAAARMSRSRCARAGFAKLASASRQHPRD